MKRYSLLALSFAGVLLSPAVGKTQASSQPGQPSPTTILGTGGLYAPPPVKFKDTLVLDRKGQTIILEPYAPNILRVTLSLQRDNALAKPGYGFVGTPNPEGWSKNQTDLNDIYQSSRIIATVERDHPPTHAKLSTELDIAKFFNGSTPGAHITFTTPEGKKLLEMTGWQQAVPNHKDGTADINNDRRLTDPEFFTVGATFVSPDDEHYYGLGDNHEGFLDHRGHPVRCWNDYLSPAAPTTCVPFLITNKGYGLIWDNPSKTTIEPGFNEQTKWSSQVGDRVSFFVIAGNTADEIYAGYRLLTGPTPLLPKAAYGYIQCKQRYTSQDEVLSVAKGYRDRHLPADVMVVDWFYYTKMGQMDMDPKFWPDPAAMNKQLHDMGFETMISVWPRFTPESRYYAELETERLAHSHWRRQAHQRPALRPCRLRHRHHQSGCGHVVLEHHPRQHPEQGIRLAMGRRNRARPAAEWCVLTRSVPARSSSTSIRCFHTGALSDGFRRDMPEKRALILSRDAYLGVQRNGAIVWSSDIYPTWDTYRRQIPTGLDFAASGITYWSNDTGGWQYLPAEHHPAHPPLLDPSDARDNVGGYDDYPGALHALVPVRHLPAHHACPRQPTHQRGLVLRQAG